MKIKDIKIEMRPREKITLIGIEYLSDAELLSILIRCGNKDHSAIELGENLIQYFGHMSNIADASLQELEKIKGIKRAKASIILASFELAKRCYGYINSNEILSDSQKVYNLMKPLLCLEKKELFYVIYLDTKCRLIKKSLMNKGGIKNVNVNIREVIKEGIKINAYGIILVHNHPSGRTKPSKEDICVTMEIVQATKLVEIVVLDHIIIGENEFYSFSENHNL